MKRTSAKEGPILGHDEVAEVLLVVKQGVPVCTLVFDGEHTVRVQRQNSTVGDAGEELVRSGGRGWPGPSRARMVPDGVGRADGGDTRLVIVWGQREPSFPSCCHEWPPTYSDAQNPGCHDLNFCDENHERHETETTNELEGPEDDLKVARPPDEPFCSAAHWAMGVYPAAGDFMKTTT